MSLPYLFKLLCLCLASFFLVHLAFALLVRLATPAALRIAARMRSSTAARLLFLIRMSPVGIGVFLVAGLCVPSYLRLEPRTSTSEEVGWVCFTFSILTVALWGLSITRGLRAKARSVRYLQHCQRVGRKTVLPGEGLPGGALPGEGLPAWMVEEPAGLFAITGIVHPRLLISRQVMSVLSGDQLTAALRHERAHWRSRDNLKRLCLLLAPDVLPFLRGFEALERGWARYTERAADERAAGGDTGRCLSLASALVRVSRLGIVPGTPSLMAPLLADNDDLSARVQRLLQPAPPAETHAGWMGCLVAGSVILSGAVLALALQPPLLYSVHLLMERLIH